MKKKEIRKIITWRILIIQTSGWRYLKDNKNSYFLAVNFKKFYPSLEMAQQPQIY